MGQDFSELFQKICQETMVLNYKKVNFSVAWEEFPDSKSSSTMNQITLRDDELFFVTGVLKEVIWVYYSFKFTGCPTLETVVVASYTGKGVKLDDIQGKLCFIFIFYYFILKINASRIPCFLRDRSYKAEAQMSLSSFLSLLNAKGYGSKDIAFFHILN